MSFEVRVVRIRLTIYHPGSLCISVLAVVVMHSIGPKFVLFHVGPLVADVHITTVMTDDAYQCIFIPAVQSPL